MGKLDDIIERKKPFNKGDLLFEDGKKLNSIFAIRSGSFKPYTISGQGDEPITDFHLAGDIIGFDGIFKMEHQSYSQAMKTDMVCR